LSRTRRRVYGQRSDALHGPGDDDHDIGQSHRGYCDGGKHDGCVEARVHGRNG